jgi:hypothetical protein
LSPAVRVIPGGVGLVGVGVGLVGVGLVGVVGFDEPPPPPPPPDGEGGKVIVKVALEIELLIIPLFTAIALTVVV